MASRRDAGDAPEARPPTEHELLRQVAAGDGAAFGVLAERLTPLLRRVLFRLGLTEVEVEDAVQEALIRVWQRSAGFEGRSAVSTWACRIVLNLGISTLRARRTPPRPSAIEVVDAEVEWESRRQAQAVRDAVLSLPLHLRAVIVLREFEDASYRTIAEVLDIPMGTVMSRLHEARARL
ncbi:MAG TPA: sigma-70 family RNA polymerase sigma factor, partial [Candidatus Dormibacteraeota bacterium]